LSQLLPHGPEQSILGYMDRLGADDYSGAGVETMRAFVIILGFAWPYVVPVLLRTATPKHDAEGKAVLPKYFVNVSKSWTSTLIKMAAELGVEAKVLLGTHAHNVSGIQIHFAMAMRIIYAECTDFTAASYFLEPWHEHVIATCGRMLSDAEWIGKKVNAPLAKALPDSMREELKPLCEVIHTNFPTCRAKVDALEKSYGMKLDVLIHPVPVSRTPTHAQMSSNPDEGENDTVSPWAIFLHALRYQAIRQDCAAPGYNRTSVDLGRPLPYCSHCRRVPYCSLVY
jgi:hypothetical protein